MTSLREDHEGDAAGDELAASPVCRRHPEGDGPGWCQDCHGVHEIARPEPLEAEYESRPVVPPPWYIAKGLPPEEWPGRAERRRILEELLAILKRARDTRAEWYVWVLERRRQR